MTWPSCHMIIAGCLLLAGFAGVCLFLRGAVGGAVPSALDRRTECLCEAALGLLHVVHVRGVPLSYALIVPD